MAATKPGPAPATRRLRRLGLGPLGLSPLARTWALGLAAAVGLGLVNLWLVLAFLRELFLTLGVL